MSFESVKAFEDNKATVGEIISSYLVCLKRHIIRVLIGDDSNINYGLLDYWAEINRVDPLYILDTIELSIDKPANFTVTGTTVSSPTNIKYVNSVLRLNDCIIIPLEWNLGR